MKKIIVMPVKNEDWILEYTLKCISLWADHIVIADQNSTDKTEEICKKFDKVVYFKNTHEGLDQSKARQMLLDKTRELFGLGNIIFALDADEVPSANILDNQDFENELDELASGESMILQWVMCLHDMSHYISEEGSVWSNSYKHFIFRDDGKLNFSDKKTSEPRMPEGYTKKSVTNNTVKVLHFQFLDMERMFAKQRRYRVFDFLEKPSFFNAIRVNRIYYETKQVVKAKTKEIPKEWLDFYQKNVGAFVCEKQMVYWYDLDILRIFQVLGTKRLGWIDIWDVNWELKRREVLNRGEEYANPNIIVQDPRNAVHKLYHKYIQGFIAHGSIISNMYRRLRRNI